MCREDFVGVKCCFGGNILLEISFVSDDICNVCVVVVGVSWVVIRGNGCDRLVCEFLLVDG